MAAAAKGGLGARPSADTRGGWATKILALTDALGNPVRFVLLPGQRRDTVGLAPLIRSVEFAAPIADKAFDASWIVEDLDERGAGIVVSRRPQRLKPLAIDAELHEWRRLIGNVFRELEEFKRVAMRADKTDRSFAAMICLCFAVIASR